jgi:hypothetical protein
MSRIARHTRLGIQWLRCGAQLFQRNPWLLGGMGACCAAAMTLLWAIPLLGGPLIALLAPIMLASLILAIERVSKLSMPLPAILRVAALKQSPQELLIVFRHERRIMPMLVVSLCSIFASLIINVLVLQIAGGAWVKPWHGLGVMSLLLVAAAILVALILYYLLAASMIYALPRTFLRDKPLFPEMARSFRAGLHYRFALLPLLALLVAPLLLGVLATPVSALLAYLAGLIAYAVLLPLVACSLFCSYRSLFPPPGAAPARR